MCRRGCEIALKKIGLLLVIYRPKREIFFCEFKPGSDLVKYQPYITPAGFIGPELEIWYLAKLRNAIFPLACCNCFFAKKPLWKNSLIFSSLRGCSDTLTKVQKTFTEMCFKVELVNEKSLYFMKEKEICRFLSRLSKKNCAKILRTLICKKSVCKKSEARGSLRPEKSHFSSIFSCLWANDFFCTVWSRRLVGMQTTRLCNDGPFLQKIIQTHNLFTHFWQTKTSCRYIHIFGHKKCPFEN